MTELALRMQNWSGRLYPDCLDVEIFLDVLQAALATIAAHLVAAEGHGRVHRLVAIDPHRAGSDRASHPMRLGDVSGPHAATQAEGRGVAALDDLVDVAERDRR